MIESRMPKENPLWPPPPPAVGWWATVTATIRATQTAVSSRIIILSRLIHGWELVVGGAGGGVQNGQYNSAYPTHFLFPPDL